MSTMEESLLEEVVGKLSQIDIRKWKCDEGQGQQSHYFLKIEDGITEDTTAETYEVYVSRNNLVITGINGKCDGNQSFQKSYSSVLVKQLYNDLETMHQEYKAGLPLEKLSSALDKYL